MRRTSLLLPVFNTLLEPARRAQSRNPDRVFDAILAKARDATDNHATLSGDDETVIDGLRFLLRCWAAAPGLSGVGWRSGIDLVTSRVVNLLKVRRIQACVPEVVDEPIRSPIFVIGLPRTASTLCHHILAEADGARAPLMWEMYNPAGPTMVIPESDADADELYYSKLAMRPGDEVELINDTQARSDRTMLLSKTWNDIHPTKADWPEEIYFFLAQGIGHLAMAPMPDYQDWYFGTHDRAADFRFVHDALQVLQYKQPRDRWVLKHPANLFCLPEILEVFPDAKIVWTHRDPPTVIGSLCSMNETLQRMHRKRRAVDLAALGRTWLDLMAGGIAKARDDRVALARPGSFVDIKYHQLTGSANKNVPTLFEQLDLPWGEADQARLEAATERAAAGLGRDGGRRHEYRLADYGLSLDDIEDAFGPEYLRQCL